MKAKYKTVVISDTHLGNKYCQSEKLLQLVSNLKCDNLILNGDIIDMWVKNKKWTTTENTIIQKVLRMARKGTNVYYLIGNHDYKFRDYVGTEFGNVKIERELILDDCLFFHGDKMDFVVSSPSLKFLAFVGDFGYNVLMRLNAIDRFIKRKFGYSIGKETLSQRVKRAVKKAMFIHTFERLAIYEAKKSNCNKVFCGHIHIADISYIDEIMYCNSGDFMEDSSYITIDFKNNVELKRI